MEKTGSDALFDYFEATYCCEDTRLGYYLRFPAGRSAWSTQRAFHIPVRSI